MTTPEPVPDEPGVYILGCLREQRVTIRSQQVRALNLISALLSSGILQAGMSVAIIGGGAAGLTAAAAAAIKGCTVSLFERKAQLLHLFLGNHTRRVHPHIYDWPNPKAIDQDAGLPILNWHAGIVGDVAEEILVGWEELQATLPTRILVHKGVSDVAVAPMDGPERTVTWTSNLQHTSSSDGIRTVSRWGRFNIVILAVGPGIERTIDPLPLVSYWRDDSLHQPELDPYGFHKRYLVSGTGDGGLIDLLRLKINNFDVWHEEILTRIDTRNLQKQLSAIENSSPTPFELAEFYKKLKTPHFVSEEIRKSMRKDTYVTLNSPDPFPFTLKSSQLNRFLVSRLLKMGAIRYRWGRIVDITPSSPHTVRFDSGAPEQFDRVIVRHGPQRALERNFPNIWSKCTTDSSIEQKLRIEHMTLLCASDFFSAQPAWLEAKRSREQILRQAARKALKTAVERMDLAWNDYPNEDGHLHAWVETKKRKLLTGNVINVYIPVTPLDRKHSFRFRVMREVFMSAQTQGIPTIILFFEPDSEQLYWGPLFTNSNKDALRTASSTVSVSKSNPLGLHCRRELIRIAIPDRRKQYVRVPVPANKVKIKDHSLIKHDARRIYNQWRQSGLPNAALEQVQFTLRGWRHLVNGRHSQASILHRLLLLKSVPDILQKVPLRQLRRRKSSGRELFQQTLLVHFPFRSDALVTVVTERIAGGPLQFLSIFERKK